VQGKQNRGVECIRKISVTPLAGIGEEVIWLISPTWATLALELLGGWRYGKDPYSEKYAIHLGPLLPLKWLVLAAVVVSPVLIAFGL
jgi:hypothetical protein